MTSRVGFSFSTTHFPCDAKGDPHVQDYGFAAVIVELFHEFDLAQPPFFGEERFERTVEAKKRDIGGGVSKLAPPCHSMLAHDEPG